MELRVNGLEEQCDDGSTVATLLTSRTASKSTNGIAVAVNDEVVPRSEWEVKSLSDGDNIEIIHAVQGG